jgi:hypothetical protein
MTQQNHEFGEFIRRSLHAAAESVVTGPEGLDRIQARLAATRPAKARIPGRMLGWGQDRDGCWPERAARIQHTCEQAMAGGSAGRRHR